MDHFKRFYKEMEDRGLRRKPVKNHKWDIDMEAILPEENDQPLNYFKKNDKE